MNNETTETNTEETTSTLSSLKARIRQLPLKKIAIAAAVTTAAAIVIANKDKFAQQTLEPTSIKILDDDGSVLADITPVND